MNRSENGGWLCYLMMISFVAVTIHALFPQVGEALVTVFSKVNTALQAAGSNGG